MLISKDLNIEIISKMISKEKQPKVINSIKNQSISKYRKSFPEDIKKFIKRIDNYFSDIDTNIEIEFKSIKESFIQISEDTKEHPEILKDILFNFCNDYIDNLYTYNKTSSKLHKEFLNILRIPEISHAVNTIKENINNYNVFSLIANCIEEEEFETASNFTSIFLSIEKINVNNFSGINLKQTSVTELILSWIEKRASITYFLQNFNGWNYNNVSILLSKHPLDNDFLHLLKTKSTQFINNDNNTNCGINTILSRDFTSERKLEIIDILYPLDIFNIILTQYYISEIYNESLSVDQLNKLDNRYFKLLKTETFFKDFIKHDVLEIFSSYSKIISLNIWDENIIKKNLIDFLIQNKKISFLENHENYFNNIFGKDFNDPDFQKLLITPTEEGKILSIFFNIVLSESFDTNIIIDYDYNGQKFDTVNDFLKKYQPFIYYFKNFEFLSKIEKDKSLPLILDNLNFYGFDTTYLGVKFVKNIYNYLRSNLDSKEFFYSYFINQYARPYYSKSNILESWLIYFTEDTIRETIVYDFENFHPIHILLDKEKNEVLINKSYSPNTYWIKKIISYFNTDIYLHKDKFGISVEKKIFKLNSHFCFPKQIKEKKSFFKNLFNKNQVYQAIKQGDNLKYITSRKDTIILPETSNSNIEQNNGDNHLHFLIKQSHQNLKEFELFIDNNSHKNINVDIKIKSENILLKNISFLKNLDISLNDIPFEDLYFLKNNLHKYLMQSLQSYMKTLDKYESLYENILKTHNIEEFENKKIKLDSEAIKQIELLDKNFELVKHNIVQQFDQNLMTDMRIQTRVLQQHVEQAKNRTLTDNNILQFNNK